MAVTEELVSAPHDETEGRGAVEMPDDYDSASDGEVQQAAGTASKAQKPLLKNTEKTWVLSSQAAAEANASDLGAYLAKTFRIPSATINADLKVAKFWLKNRHKKPPPYTITPDKKAEGVYHLKVRNPADKMAAGAKQVEDVVVRLNEQRGQCGACFPKSTALVKSTQAFCAHKILVVADKNLDISVYEKYAKKENQNEKRDRERAEKRAARAAAGADQDRPLEAQMQEQGKPHLARGQRMGEKISEAREDKAGAVKKQVDRRIGLINSIPIQKRPTEVLNTPQLLFIHFRCCVTSLTLCLNFRSNGKSDNSTVCWGQCGILRVLLQVGVTLARVMCARRKHAMR